MGSVVEFSYGDCGQPLGTTGTPGDLLARKLEIMSAQFARDMKIALETGQLGWRSSSMLGTNTDDALNEVAANPTTESIIAACESYAEFVQWLCNLD
jgi:hypothetical protein